MLTYYYKVLMPCRALEAFGPEVCAAWPSRKEPVLMPCRALEAFGHSMVSAVASSNIVSLNALSGIGGVRSVQEARAGAAVGG